MAHKVHTTSGADTNAACFTDLSIAELAALLAGDNTPVTPTSVAASGGVTSSSPSAGVGYATGAGGAVTQGTDKSTTVILSTVTGKITTNAAQLNASAIVSFTLTNTRMLATDNVVLNHVSGGTSGAYTVNIFPSDGSAVISIRNNSAGNLSEALVLRFSIIRSANA